MTAAAPTAERLELVAETDAHEGPVYAAREHALYFTSVRRGSTVALRRLDLRRRTVATLLDDANAANGMTLDGRGRLLICEQGTLERRARISRLDLANGRLETLVDAVDGLPLNSPNDVAVGPDGAVWFTDPSYGFLQGFRPAPELPDRAYRCDPETGETTPLPWEFDKPNGIALSADGRTLYVSDNGAPHHLVAFDVVAGRARCGRVVAAGTPEHPDGLKVGPDGRVYASAAYGVQVLEPDGSPAGEIELPGTVNFCFGGRDGRSLYVTADTAVWAVSPTPKGA